MDIMGDCKNNVNIIYLYIYLKYIFNLTELLTVFLCNVISLFLNSFITVGNSKDNRV